MRVYGIENWRLHAPRLVRETRGQANRRSGSCVFFLGGALDEAAIREFLESDYARVVAAVAMACGSYAAAEDAVQEALVRAWERGPSDDIRSTEAWLIAVSLNLSRSWLRRTVAERRARRRLSEEEQRVTDPDAVLDVRAALDGLPRRQREATVLRYYLEMRVDEIASVLAVSEGTVKTALHRARGSLAAALRYEERGAVRERDR